MDPGKPNRNAELRAAVVSALVGLYWLVQGILSYREGLGSAAWIFIVIALVFLGLAVPIYRGSDGAALAVAGTFVVLMLFTVLAGGVRALFPWPVVMAVMLGAGMYGVLAPGSSLSAWRARRR